MADSRDVVELEVGVDPARCVLCGEANDCAIARGEGASDEPCWCVERSFPADLTERASARDGGASCICRRCLDRDPSAKTGSA